MFKRLLDGDGHGVGFLAAGNLMLSGAENFLSKAEPALHFLLSCGQIAVAVVTVIYILRKVQTVKTRKRRVR